MKDKMKIKNNEYEIDNNNNEIINNERNNMKIIICQ